MSKRLLITDKLTNPDAIQPTPTDWVKMAKINSKTDLPPTKPSVIIDNIWVCTEGDMMQVSGQKKAGKSNVLKYLVATALMPEVDTMQTLGIRASYTKKDVIFIDTEQSMQKTQQFCRRVLQIANLPTDPPNLHFYNIRAADMKQRVDFLTNILFKEHKEPALVVIDGITDFIDSVNNEEVSKTLIDSLLKRLGGELSIVVTIHENKDGNGARGHIGQEIERKCVGAISISKDRKTKTHKMVCKLVRDGADFDDIIFAYDTELKDFRRLDAAEIKATQAKSEEDKLTEIKDLFEQIFATNSQMDKANVIKGILLYDNSINRTAMLESQKTQAARRLKKALDNEIILQNSDKLFYLND